ncbi:fasciclin domain-containing protein [Nostoc sp. CCY0012]|uniref:fasciclin domain-containing protein n=1 Tax=Nostoc sp. CCY0012 TaxID=1056123 RepID=UPI0039C5DAF3
MNTFLNTRVVKGLAILTGLLGISVFSSLPAIADNHSSPSPGAATTTTGASANANIVDLAASNESFSTLVQAVQEAGLADTLSGSGPYTVFAPTNEAFADLPDGALEFLLQPENRSLLQQVLTYHVVPGSVTSDQLSTGPVSTLGGGVAIRVAPDRVIVNDGSVVQPDIQASNGVVHGVNRVLLPRELRQALISQLNGQQQAY